MKKKLFILIMMSFFIFGIFSPSAIAIDSIVNQNELITYQGFDSIENIMLKTSKQIHSDLKSQLEKDLLTIESFPTLTIGTNTSANSAAYAGSSQEIDSGTPIFNHKAKTESGGWADCKVNCSEKIANGQAYAWLSKAYTVAAGGGSSARNCEITFLSDNAVTGYLYHSKDVLAGT